jgi:hypothetical protein
MAQVFQCDACKKTADKAGVIDKYELCAGCLERVKAVLNPKPRGPKPAQ